VLNVTKNMIKNKHPQLTKENLKAKKKLLKELESKAQPFNYAHYELEKWWAKEGYDLDRTPLDVAGGEWN
jgi:hypothetical protein